MPPIIYDIPVRYTLYFILLFIFLEKYIELKVHQGKFVPLMSILPMKLTSPQLSFISFDCHTNELTVETQAGLTIPIIPNIMKLKNVKFIITATLTRIPRTFEIETKGNWKLGSLFLNVDVVYYYNSGSTEIKVVSKSISIDKVVKQLTGLTLPGTPQKLPSFTFSGFLESDGSATLILSSDKSKKNKFYAFYQQERGEGAPAKAIAVDIAELKLSTVLKSTIRVDISNVPFFGRLALKGIGLTLSSGLITDLPKDTFDNTILLKRNGVAIESGLKAYVMLPFLSKPVTITYSRGILKFKTASKKLGLKSLLKAIGSKFNLGKLRLPKQLDAIFSLYVNEITVFRGRVSVNIIFPKPISLFQKLLVFSDMIVTIYISNQRPKVSVKVKGNVILAGTKFKTTLVQDKWKKYTLTAIGDYLDIHKVFVKFSAAVLPDIVSSFLKNIPFLHFGIQKPTIFYRFNANPMHLELGGTPVINGFRALHFDVIITKRNRKVTVLMGFELFKINIAATLKTLTGFDFRSFALLNQDLSITITIAPISTRKLSFKTGGLKGVPINKGVSVTASMGFPDNCDKKKFCRLASKLIGRDASFSIQATIVSATRFPLTASISNLHIGKKIVLSRASIQLVGGISPSVGIIGVLKLSNPAIILSASISVSIEGLSLGLSMDGCWKNVFNKKWLSICNLLGSISFAPVVGVSGFEIGGEIHLGYKSTGKQVKAKGYVGINLIDPNDNFYYVSFTSVTVGSLLQAFKVKARIPKPLAESGFPKGFMSSFSLAGKELPQVHLSIPAGFRLKGTLRILGLEGMVDVTINIPNGIDFKVGLSPITIASGLLKMYASSTDHSKGPYLRAVVRLLPKPYINIEAKGYVSFLGISLETSLKISNSEYRFFIRGSMWGLFQASLLVQAKYGNIKTAGFRIKGELKNDLFEKIQKTVVNALNDSAKKATAAINKAKDKIERAKAPFNRAINRLNRAQWKVNQAKQKINRAADKVAATRRRLMSRCRIQHCKKCKF